MRFFRIFVFWVLCFAAVPVVLAGSPDSPFGVLEFLSWNHDWNRYKYPDKAALKKTIALMKEVGAGWVRMDFLWQDMEPEKGRFDFQKYDTIVDLLSKNDIMILGIVSE